MQSCYAQLQSRAEYEGNGWGGIRTPGTFRYTRFPGVHNRPLCHPSRLKIDNLSRIFWWGKLLAFQIIFRDCDVLKSELPGATLRRCLPAVRRGNSRSDKQGNRVRALSRD